jgi:hypothetical protein
VVAAVTVAAAAAAAARSDGAAIGSRGWLCRRRKRGCEVCGRPRERERRGRIDRLYRRAAERRRGAPSPRETETAKDRGVGAVSWRLCTVS